MRKIVAFTLMGIDGAVEDPRLLFLPSDVPDEPFFFDEESDAFESAATATQDAVLLGRNQWERWQRFWPGASGPFADFINGCRQVRPDVASTRGRVVRFGRRAGSAP